MTALCFCISSVTLTSPIFDRKSGQPNRLTDSCSADVVDRFATTGPGFLPRTLRIASRRVYSSPIATPFSETIARRSASMSWAKPTSASCALTAAHRSPRFSASGSAGRGNNPFGFTLIVKTSAPNASSSFGPTNEPAPLQASRTTRSFCLRIANGPNASTIVRTCRSVVPKTSATSLISAPATRVYSPW